MALVSGPGWLGEEVDEHVRLLLGVQLRRAGVNVSDVEFGMLGLEGVDGRFKDPFVGEKGVKLVDAVHHFLSGNGFASILPGLSREVPQADGDHGRQQGAEHECSFAFSTQPGKRLVGQFHEPECDPRSEKDQPEEAVLEQLEPIAEHLVCDGEQAEQHHGGGDGTKEPCLGLRLATAQVAGHGQQVQDEVGGLQGRYSGQCDRGVDGVLESERCEELDEQGEEVLADPEVLNVGQDFVDDAQSPEERPEAEDGQAEKESRVHGASSVWM